MTRISSPIEETTRGKEYNDTIIRADFVVVGSGYGGAVAAMRLAGAARPGEAPQEVVVLERGKEYGLGDFPYDIADIPSHIRMATGQGYSDALFTLYTNLQIQGQVDLEESWEDSNSPVDVLVGSGLGGTSLINANVAEEPQPHIFRKESWPEFFRETDNPLQDEFAIVRQYLGVTTHNGVDGKYFPKYRALTRLGKQIGGEVRPAKIAVSTDSGANAMGVEQNACTDCGNCVTGCNIGAKNTLDRNLLRLAKARGAEMYTGVTVERIVPTTEEGYRWALIVKPTAPMKGEQTPKKVGDGKDELECYVVLAHNIVLAAGTMGTTEILLKSNSDVPAKCGNKLFSDGLGKRFSTNGDGIVMSYGQKRRVGSIAGPEQKNPVNPIGPTITGIVQTKGVTIEEAAIPASLTRLFAEFVSTSAMIQRLANRKVPKFLKKENLDPLAGSMQVADHSQAFLVMGDDGAPGELGLGGNASSPKIGIKRYPNAAKTESLVTANELIKKEDRDKGLDDGQYAPNLLWQLMPPEARTVMSGEMPQSRAITVHPLGGCSMGDDHTQGVVDQYGQVFRRDGGTHDGLYVMDGSMLPSAIEVNPFLTIAALAWRAVGALLFRESLVESVIDQAGEEERTLGEVPDRRAGPLIPTTMAISEQLTGELEGELQAFEELSEDDRERLSQRSGLVVEVSASSSDAENWLENPGRVPLSATMQLSVNPLPERDVNRFRPVGVNRAHRYKEPFLTMKGTFTIFEERDYNWWTDHWGGIKAVATYVKRRGIPPLKKRERRDVKDGPGPIKKALVFYNIGKLQSRYRTLKYEFTDDSGTVTAKGKKVLGYSYDLKRMWQELLWLDLKFQESGDDSASARLVVNTDFLLDPGLVQARESANLPRSLLFAAGFAGYFGRILFGTNFWEFAGIEYPDRRPQNVEPPAEIKGGGKKASPNPIPLRVPLTLDPGNQEEIELKLTHYLSENTSAPEEDRTPVLMLHGLAQGSQIFWTQGIENMASFFLKQGHDVWLLDYRLSNWVLPHINGEGWTMDEIARYDIPAAIHRVYSETKKPINIVAHCVGACTFAMAILDEERRAKDAYFDANYFQQLGIKPEPLHEMVHGAVLNAIHPWVRTSASNRFRSKLGNFAGLEFVPQQLLDPIPKKTDGAMQNLVDRIGYGLARTVDISEAESGQNGAPSAPGSAEDHLDSYWDDESKAICDRMSFLYGRMWNHENLSPATHAAFRDMLGPAPVGVYMHLYYYSEQQRITDRHGENVYLTRPNIQKYWKLRTLFVHGDISRVFNPHSAERSAIKMNTNMRKPGEGMSKQYPVGFKRFPNYGHMDVIFGKDAHETCFPLYRKFLTDEYTPKDPLENREKWLRRVWETSMSDFQPEIRKKVEKAVKGKREKDQKQPAKAAAAAGGRDWHDVYAARPVTGPILRAAWVEGDKLKLRYWAELRINRVVAQNNLRQRGNSGAKDFAVAKSARYRCLDITLDKAKSVAFELYGSMGIQDDHGLKGVILTYANEAWYRRLVQGGHGSSRMRFLVGSCRYPGTVLDNEMSDRVYTAMSQRIGADSGAELLFLTGDQIYADATDQLLVTRNLRTRYTGRYRQAFMHKTSPNFAELVRQIPTHFALDDHEIDDNWSGIPVQSGDDYEMFSFGRRKAVHYQGSARNKVPVNQVSSKNEFYYALDTESEADFPTFVMDTRTERQYRKFNQPEKYSLIGVDQWDALTEWLEASHQSATHKDSPKFIVCGSVLAPVSRGYVEDKESWRRQDGWAGYPKTLETLLAFIVEKQIEKVVFVGGDAHLSAVSRLDIALPNGDQGTVWQIVSSGCYAPMPFANSRVNNIVWDTAHDIPVQLDEIDSISCSNRLLSDHYSQFVQVDATEANIVVACYNANNRLLGKQEITF